EHRRSAGEHRQTASEIQTTASEHMRTAGEHRPTLSEHMPGDVSDPIERLPSNAYATKSRRSNSRLGRALRRDLHGDRQSLAKAWLLREVLGPAPGLKSPAESGPDGADPV
ncbi:MAG: hypothetical protein AAFX50_24440, partial [Acidobacteriota bacterium]